MGDRVDSDGLTHNNIMFLQSTSRGFYKVPGTSPVKIFYAWQSDLDQNYNRYAIRKALKRAVLKLEETSISPQTLRVEFLIDEATRDLPGSPHIPSAILEKIEKSDIFVADVSAINISSNPEKCTPNPNVVFELGYAVARLGWERILLLINTALGGEAALLPFDFDRQRASLFKLGPEMGTQEVLDQLVFTSVQLIIKKDPPRSDANHFDAARALRSRDLTNIAWLLKSIHLPTVDQHVRNSARFLTMASADLSEEVDAVVSSSTFHLYDDRLRAAVLRFAETWSSTVDPNFYFPSGSRPISYRFTGTERDLESLNQLRTEMAQAWDLMLALIRERFPEIDLSMTSRQAGIKYGESLEN